MPSREKNQRCNDNTPGFSCKCPCKETELHFNCRGHQETDLATAKTDNACTSHPSINRRKLFRPANDDEAKIRNYYGEEDVSHVDELIRTHDASMIREQMYAVQERLYSFHAFLDVMEKLKAENTKLEEELANEEEVSTKQEEKLKSVGNAKIESLEEEMIELKLELAHSRGREDHYSTEMRKITEETEQMGRLAQALRDENAKFRRQRSSSVSTPGANIASFFGFSREENPATESPKAAPKERTRFETFAKSFKMESVPRRSSFVESGMTNTTTTSNNNHNGVANFFGFSNIKARTVGCEKKTEKMEQTEIKQIRVNRRHSLNHGNLFKNPLWKETETARRSDDVSDDMSVATCPNPADAAAGPSNRSSRQEKSHRIEAR